MFVRNGNAVGSILHRDESTAKRQTKKSTAAKKAAAKKTAEAEPSKQSDEHGDKVKESGDGD